MSTHKVEVVRVEQIEPHPNATRLVLTRVWGYGCCIGKDQFQVGDLAAYIEPDNLVDPGVPEFSFLAPKATMDKYNGRVRIRVSRLRGVLSQGLLVPARPHWKLGDDVSEELKVVHYDPPLPLSTGGEAERPPPGYHPRYDVESFYRHPGVFAPGEPVVITEKIHGASARYTYVDGRLYAGSRSEWKRPNEQNLWWRALATHPKLAAFCQAHPELTVYGEVYGQVQDLTYGAPKGGAFFAAFDLLRGNEWVPYLEARDVAKGIPWVPELYRGPFDAKLATEWWADGPSRVPGADHLREGCIIKTLAERTDPIIGRAQLKIVSNAYLERTP